MEFSVGGLLKFCSMKAVIVHDTKTSAMAFGYGIKSMYNFDGILVEEFHAHVIILQTLQ